MVCPLSESGSSDNGKEGIKSVLVLQEENGCFSVEVKT